MEERDGAYPAGITLDTMGLPTLDSVLALLSFETGR